MLDGVDSFGGGGGAQSFLASGLDVALLSEAHGLVTDLLLEAPTMPPHLASGLKALANLLSPPTGPSAPYGGGHHGGHQRRHQHQHHQHQHHLHHAAFADVHYSSDTEDMPYTGEPLPLHAKVGLFGRRAAVAFFFFLCDRC